MRQSERSFISFFYCNHLNFWIKVPDKETFQSSELREAQTQENTHTHTYTHTRIYIYICVCVCVCKGKAISLQAWTGPEGSREVPRYRDNGTRWW